MQTGLIQNAHNDLVTDACYDFYGLHLATCSIDQRIKVWTLDEDNGQWSVQDDWKAHDATVAKLSWAHPEFGSILASCSFDRTVKIWEQNYSESGPQVNSTNSLPSRWAERAVLLDSRGTVRAVEFAPHYFGLKLATISSDNFLRVYECLEQPSLTTWQSIEEVDIQSLPTISSSLSMNHTLTSSTPTQTSTSLDGAPPSLVSHALQQQQQHAQPLPRPGMGNREADGGWCISWCKDKYWGEVIATSCGVNGAVKIIQLSPSRRPITVLTLDPYPIPHPPPSEDVTTTKSSETSTPSPYAVTTVSWAPSCGRSTHLIATGSRDGHVRIWRLKPPTPDDHYGDTAEGKWSGNIVADFDDHKSSVGRVDWNVTGTVLSSSGNDGRVRLWKATIGNIWRPAGHISVEQAEEQLDTDVDMDENTMDN